MKNYKFIGFSLQSILILIICGFTQSCLSDDKQFVNEALQQELIDNILADQTSENLNNIITSFEHLSLNDSLCIKLSKKYLQAVTTKFELEKAYARVDSVLRQKNCPECKLQTYTKMGEKFYVRSIGDSGLKFFDMALKENLNKRYADSKYTQAAQSFKESLTSLQIGDSVEGFLAKDIKGKEIVIEPNQNKIILLDFWATWCKPCVADLPILQRINEKYGEREDFQLISVSSDTDLEKLNSYLESVDMPWTQLCDGLASKSPLVKQFKGFILPTYYILDLDGKIQCNFFSRRDGINLEETLDELFTAESIINDKMNTI